MINGVEYANISEPIREGEKVRKTYENLGRVLDKERGIFQNRKRGVFTYSVEKGYGKPPVDFVPEVNLSMEKSNLYLILVIVFL
jgi:hypothetical protein